MNGRMDADELMQVFSLKAVLMRADRCGRELNGFRQ